MVPRKVRHGHQHRLFVFLNTYYLFLVLASLDTCYPPEYELVECDVSGNFDYCVDLLLCEGEAYLHWTCGYDEETGVDHVKVCPIRR